MNVSGFPILAYQTHRWVASLPWDFCWSNLPAHGFLVPDPWARLHLVSFFYPELAFNASNSRTSLRKSPLNSLCQLWWILSAIVRAFPSAHLSLIPLSAKRCAQVMSVSWHTKHFFVIFEVKSDAVDRWEVSHLSTIISVVLSLIFTLEMATLHRLFPHRGSTNEVRRRSNLSQFVSTFTPALKISHLLFCGMTRNCISLSSPSYKSGSHFEEWNVLRKPVI